MRTERDAAFNSVLNALCTQLFCPVSANDPRNQGHRRTEREPGPSPLFPDRIDPFPRP